MKIGVGIIGTSGIATHYANKLQKISGVSLEWIYSRSKQRAETFAQKHAIPHFSNQLTPLLEDKNTHALLILNEPIHHIQIALMGLKAKKHLLIEKPLAVDPTDAKILLDRAKTCKNQTLSVISPFRFNPILREMKTYLENETHGTPKTAILSLMWQRDQTYYEKGNGWRVQHSPVFVNQGIHWLDVLNWFFGVSHTVYATSRATRPFLHCPDQSSALIEYLDGVSVVAVAGTFTSKKWPDQLTIYHARGRLDYQEQLGPPPPDGFKTRLGRWLLNQPRWGRSIPDGMLLQLEDFFASIREGRPPTVTLTHGLEALKLANAVSRVLTSPHV